MKEQNKHIIAGVPRAGKTTICHHLATTLKYQHLAMDSLVIAFEKVFPNTGVLHTDCWDFIKTSKNFAPFLEALCQTKCYEGLNYKLAFDLYHITPKDYMENIDQKKCSIYFFGYPNISVQEKFKEIRKFDTKNDWTSHEDDLVVLEHLTKYIEISKWLQKECEKYHLPFIDISKNREDVIEEFIKEIIN